MNTPHSTFDAFKQMETHGGGFAAALAAAWFRADATNKATIEHAFPTLIEAYRAKSPSSAT